MKLMILILAVSYLVVIGLFMVYGHLRYKKRIKDLGAIKDMIYQYYCPTCKNFFKVRYYIKEIKPMDSVECPFCKNNIAAFIINYNDASRIN